MVIRSSSHVSLERSPAARGIEWLETFGDALFRYAFARVHDSETAEDLVQETLLAAQRSGGPKDEDISERRWLEGIMDRLIMWRFREISSLRAGFPVPNFAADQFETNGDWAGNWRKALAPHAWHKDDLSVGKTAAFWVALNRALSSLPPAMSIAFSLREIEGHSTEAICDTLHVSVRELSILLNEARLCVRQAIDNAMKTAVPSASANGNTLNGPNCAPALSDKAEHRSGGLHLAMPV